MSLMKEHIAEQELKHNEELDAEYQRMCCTICGHHLSSVTMYPAVCGMCRLGYEYAKYSNLSNNEIELKARRMRTPQEIEEDNHFDPNPFD